MAVSVCLLLLLTTAVTVVSGQYGQYNTSFPDNMPPQLQESAGAVVVAMQGAALRQLVLAGTYIQNVSSIVIGGLKCAGQGGEYQTDSEPCRIYQTRNEACLYQVRNQFLNAGSLCEGSGTGPVEPCTSYSYWYGTDPNTQCSLIPEGTDFSCQNIDCGYSSSGIVCAEFPLSVAYSHGVQCGPRASCDFNNRCVDAGGWECASTVACTPPDPLLLAPGTYDAVLTTPLGSASSTAAYIVLAAPQTANAPVLAAAGAPYSVDVDYGPGNAAALALQSLEALGVSFLEVVPELPVAGGTGMVSLTATYYSALYNQTFSVPAGALQYVEAPLIYNLCPQVALAFTSTAVLVRGAGLHNVTRGGAGAGVFRCLFGGEEVPATLLSSTEVVCTVSPSAASATSINLTVTNDGVVFAAPLALSVLGSCATLKPNSYPLAGVCTCPPGFSDAGYACVPCAADTYQPASGQQSCLACDPTRATANGTQTDAAACLCRDGYLPAPGGVGQCQPCPAGLLCRNQTVSTRPGFWRPAPASLQTAVCAAPAERCPGGEAGAAGDTLCAVGYAGPACAACAAGWGPAGSSAGGYGAVCARCRGGGGDEALLAFLVALIVGGMWLLVRTTTQEYAGESRAASEGSLAILAKIAVNYAQVLYYVGSLSVQWGSAAPALFAVLTPMALSPSTSVAQCALRWGFYERMAVVMALPAAVAAGIACVFAVLALAPRWIARYATLDGNAYWRSLLVVLYFLHPTVAHETLTSLHCVPVQGLPDRYVAGDMSVSCATAGYAAYTAGTVAYIVLYVVGAPALLAWRMVRARDAIETAMNSGGGDNAHRYLYFARGYTQREYMWEFAVLARKLAVVATLLSGQPAVQLLWCAAILSLSGALTLRLQPFRSHADNWMEMVTLLALSLSVIYGQNASVYGGTAEGAMAWLLVVTNLGAAAVLLWLAAPRLLGFARRGKLAASHSVRSFGRWLGALDDEPAAEIQMYTRKSAALPSGWTPPTAAAKNHVDTPRPGAGPTHTHSDESAW